jgi:hypothetical protein
MDGDGNVGIYNERAQVRIVGSRRLLSAYAEFVRKSGALGAKALTVRPHSSIYVVSSGWSTAVRIADLLYSGAATALDRKAQAAQEIKQKAIQHSPTRLAPMPVCVCGHRWTEGNTYWRNAERHCQACRRPTQSAAGPRLALDLMGVPS